MLKHPFHFPVSLKILLNPILTISFLIVLPASIFDCLQETQVRFLGQEDPMEKEMATHSIFLPGESHGQRSLAGHNPWGHKESDMSE